MELISPEIGRRGSMTTRLRRCVVVGHGAVGQLFASLLVADGAQVCVVDRKTVDDARGFRTLTCDINDPDAAVRAELADAELVVLALDGAGRT